MSDLPPIERNEGRRLFNLCLLYGSTPGSTYSWLQDKLEHLEALEAQVKELKRSNEAYCWESLRHKGEKYKAQREVEDLRAKLSKAHSDSGWQAEYQRQQDEFDQTGRYL